MHDILPTCKSGRDVIFVVYVGNLSSMKIESLKFFKMHNAYGTQGSIISPKNPGFRSAIVMSLKIYAYTLLC